MWTGMFRQECLADIRKSKSCELLDTESSVISIVILVGGLEHFLFSIIYGIILPID